MTKFSYAPIKILVADDHQVVREGFYTMLKKYKSAEVVGEAVNGNETIELVEKLKPDIIFMDIRMPKMDGIEATRKITERHPEIGVIAFTMYEEESNIVDMLEAGAQGYLTKNASKEEIFEAIEAIVNRKTYYCRETTSRLAQLIAKSKFDPNKKLSQQVFNKREKEIIHLICEQFSNKEIANELNLSIRTVEGYRERIQEKMSVKNTAGIVVYAIKKGLYKIDSL